MADVQRSASFHHSSKARKRVSEEPGELVRTQVVVLDSELIFCIALVRRIIRTIPENKIGHVSGHQSLHIRFHRGVTHKQFVITEEKKIAGHGDRRLRQLRNSIFVRQSFGGILGGEQPGEFFVFEPDETKIEVRILEGRNSARSVSSFHPALSASWLSAITRARRCASVRCESTITGTSLIPSFLAAANLA